METVLKVTMSLDSVCNLFATDASNYESLLDVNKHAIVEILADKTEENKFQRLHTITGISDPLLYVSETINLAKDGTYTYYRLIIPQVSELLHDGTYQAKNKYFSVDTNVYYSTQNFTAFDAKASYIRLVEDYKEIWDNKDENYLYWFNIKVFSICRLNNCITKKISQWICEVRSKSCKSTRSIKLDFLLEASFALKYLVEQSRFEDAQRILDSLTSCGSPCENLDVNDDCNCGNTV